MTALAVVYRPLADLVPYARNSRTHSEAQVAQIAASIREFGWTNPVLVDGENGIIAGHGRVMAARVLGLDQVPCIELAGMSEAQRRAYVIADNKLALNAGWDEAALEAELAALTEQGFDLRLIGFDADELSAILGDADPGGDTAPSGAGSLAARFLVPPFSVLNAREGWWQDRKRAWISLGIKSELGRGGGAGNAATSANGYAERGWDAELRRDIGAGGAVQQATQDRSQRQRGGVSPPRSAAPGGSARPAADYSKRQRGDGAGKAMNG